MSEFQLKRRSPDEQTLYFMEKIGELKAEREAFRAVLDLLLTKWDSDYALCEGDWNLARELLARVEG